MIQDLHRRGGRWRVFEYDVATGVTSTITMEGHFVASSADGSRVYYLAGGDPNLSCIFGKEARAF